LGRGRSITSIQPMIRARRQTEIHQHDFANGTHVVWNRVCYASLDSTISRWAPAGSDRRGAYLHIKREFCCGVRALAKIREFLPPAKFRTEGAMSESGQKRPKGGVRVESALPQTADIGGRGWQVSCVPQPDSCTAAKRHPRTAIIYSITSSARSRNDSGIASPSALAVLRLMTNWYLEACSTGRSAGLAPLRILSI
jgi:hypothetical protein